MRILLLGLMLVLAGVDFANALEVNEWSYGEVKDDLTGEIRSRGVSCIMPSSKNDRAFLSYDCSDQSFSLVPIDKPFDSDIECSEYGSGCWQEIGIRMIADGQKLQRLKYNYQGKGLPRFFILQGGSSYKDYASPRKYILKAFNLDKTVKIEYKTYDGELHIIKVLKTNFFEEVKKCKKP